MSDTVGFILHYVIYGLVQVLPAAGYGVHGYRCSVGKYDLHVTCFKPYLGPPHMRGDMCMALGVVWVCPWHCWWALCGHWESVQWVDGPLSVPLHFSGTGGFIGGPHVAIGKLFYRLMANSHSHSVWALEAVCPMVCFIPCPLDISFTHPFHTNRSQTVLCSHQALTWHQDWTWLGLCVSWFTSSHLPCHLIHSP